MRRSKGRRSLRGLRKMSRGRRGFLKLAGLAGLASLVPKDYRKGYYHPSLRGELHRRMVRRRRQTKGATT